LSESNPLPFLRKFRRKGVSVLCHLVRKIIVYAAQCNGVNVGAIIDRPAVQCRHFAGNCGESALPAARALNERPYIDKR